VTRRPKGDGGLSWEAARERWVASATIGYDGRGKRIVRRGRGRTKTEAKNKLRQLLRIWRTGWSSRTTATPSLRRSRTG
jgi:hypothetical protein